MEDEGQPVPTETTEAAPQPEGEATQPATETPSAPPQVPPKYAGKTPDELTAILTEQEKYIGRQGQELGQLRDAVERLWSERHGQTSQQRPPQGEPEPEFDYEKPKESVQKIVQANLKKAWEHLDKMRRSDVAQSTNRAFLEGRELMKQNPHLYSGIEQDVATEVANTLGPLAAQGQDVSHLLRDPKTWRLVAIAVRDARGELDKIQAPGRKGMAPTDTELPTPTRQTQDDDGIIIEDSDRQDFKDIEGRAGTDKEIREMVKLGLKTVKRR